MNNTILYDLMYMDRRFHSCESLEYISSAVFWVCRQNPDAVDWIC